MGYGTANMANNKDQDDLKEVLEHVANHNKMVVANLAQANKMLTQQVKATQDQIDILVTKIDEKPSKTRDKNCKLQNCYYFWTHGIALNWQHTSKLCHNH
eukprot:15365601-Ditylum_brightwellii.AAC.1